MMIYLILGGLNLAIIFVLYYWAFKNSNCKHGLAILMLKILPAELTGNVLRMARSNHGLIGEQELSDHIQNIKINNMEKYLIIWFIFSCLFILVGIQNYGDQQAIKTIERPEFGSQKDKVQVEVIIEKGNLSISEDIVLNVNPKQLTTLQKQELINAYAAKLPEIILADNNSTNEIKSSLDLKKKDLKTGIELTWQSSNPEIIREDGFVNSLMVENTTRVSLFAELVLGDVKELAEIKTKVLNNSDSSYIKEFLHIRLDELINKLDGSTGRGSLYLPAENGQGTILNWYHKTQDYLPQLLILFLLSIAMTYVQRYAKTEKLAKKRQESIIREFPDFISKFVLLLSAGLVVSTALKKIALNYDYYNENKFKKPLYEDLAKMQERMRSTNASLTQELKNYAEASGLKEIMRFATIVSDNIDKGSTLAEKLEAEGSLLWHNRKKKAEELGRLAETKLVLPLMILLLVLIMITIAPALITM